MGNDAQIPLGPGFAFNRAVSKTEYMSATLEQKKCLDSTRQSIHEGSLKDASIPLIQFLTVERLLEPRLYRDGLLQK